MGFVFRLEDYARYLERVGKATYLDVSRRTDPARVDKVWDNLRAVIEAYGAPWIVQLWTKDAAGTLARGGSLLRRLLNTGTTLAANVGTDVRCVSSVPNFFNFFNALIAGDTGESPDAQSATTESKVIILKRQRS